jgi:isopenicillin-N N-acyltransferase like protein
MVRSIPIVISKGDPFTRGQHLGSCESGRVRQASSAYMALFKQLSALSRDDVFSEVERFLPTINAYAPHLLDEMRGIAKGSACDLREIVAINMRTELMYGLKRPLECTAIGVTPAASADKHVRLAQNWDWHPSLTGAIVLWVIQRDDGPDVITLTEAGMVGKIGINAAGLAMCVNLLKSDTDYNGPAIPMHIILRHVLENAQSVEEAISLIERAERCTSCHHLVADRSGSLAGIEATPAGQYVLSPDQGVLTHTNHCVDAVLFARDRGARENPETVARGARAHTLAEARPIDESYLCSILRDHATSPDSICLHNLPELPFEMQGESIASIIFDLTAGTLDLADGPPCQHEYRRLALADYFGTTA